MSEYDGSDKAQSGTDAARGTASNMARQRGDASQENRQSPTSGEGEGGKERDTQAGQEGDRAAAALDNNREGFGGPSGSRQGRSTPTGDSAREVARRQGEDDA
jgi:hypothetical protein